MSALTPLVEGTDAVWIAAALTEGDRLAAASGVVEADDVRVRLLALDTATYRAAYDVMCNGVMWFAHHGLFDLPRRPRLDRHVRAAWGSYREVNDAFADAAAEAAPDGAVVLAQDYHLCLVAPRLREARPDLRVVHFSHTPFATPEWLRAIPDDAARELLTGMAAFDACAFHSQRWADDFLACAAAHGVTPPPTAVTPLTADIRDLDRVAASADAAAAADALDALVGDRRLILRVDRMELSKNLLRGFHAYDLLLEEHPEWRGRVVFGALVYPSREGLSEYLSYRQEVEGLVRLINNRWGTDDWQPILYEPDDDFPRSVAALRRADVLFVNPVRDGQNLVAVEGAYLNARDGVLVLSTEAGAWDWLGPAGAIGVNPFDVVAQADALHEALAMDGAERSTRAASLRAAAASRSPADWLAAQHALVSD